MTKETLEPSGSRSLEINGTRVLDDHLSSTAKIKVHQGGTRSSKTYSLCQAVIIKALSAKLQIDVIRKYQPSLKATAAKDFFEVLQTMGLYDRRNHNRQDNIYKLGQSEIAFYGVDDAQKVRGRARDIIWINEANELTYDDWRQLSLRTRLEIWIDYNPSDEHHWIYDHVLTRKDAQCIMSTYKDNPFLEPSQVDEIERLREEDDEYWRIFGLGERGTSRATVYNNWTVGEPLDNPDEVIYGMDFGFNNPSALVQLSMKENSVFVRELVYQSRLTNLELIGKVKSAIGAPPYRKPMIYADAAEPARITEFCQAGFNCMAAEKEVEKGIEKVRRLKLIIDKHSPNLLKEIKGYRWKTDKDGRLTEEPVKYMDHLMDAMRYAVNTHIKGRGGPILLFGKRHKWDDM